jgi:dUTP pyrophosphatase
MATKIKIKMLNNSIVRPQIIGKGDWIDLRAAQDIDLKGPYVVPARKDIDRKVIFNDVKVPLGVAMELPKGFEAPVIWRSGTYKNYKVILANGEGLIDNLYNGDDDQWFAHIVPFEDGFIAEGDRICQFRIQLSQKATMWQKLKWLFSNGVKLEFVESLGNPNRGGHSSTGVK